jgi:hypothetical protein
VKTSPFSCASRPMASQSIWSRKASGDGQGLLGHVLVAVGEAVKDAAIVLVQGALRRVQVAAEMLQHQGAQGSARRKLAIATTLSTPAYSAISTPPKPS